MARRERGGGDEPHDSNRHDSNRRAPWRRVSDDEAHALDEELAPIMDHAMVVSAEPELIKDEQMFRAAIADLRREPVIAYDTEFIGEHTYYPRICLVQIATADRVLLIDPLAGIDLDPFWELVAREKPVKIVHAGLQDLEPALRLVGRPAAGVFDTQIAAGMCGMRYPASLKDVVAEFVGGEIGRGLKFSQWDRRPLSEKQLRYAADDVRYLLLLHERLTAKLEELGRSEWASEEFASFADPRIYRTDPATRKLKVKALSKMRMRPRTALRELVVWREDVARERDVSPRVLISDEALKGVAEGMVTTKAEMAKVKGLSKAVVRDLGDEIGVIVSRVFEGPKPPRPPRRVRPSDAEQAAMDQAWSALGELCEEQGIATSLVTNRRELSDHVLRLVRGKAPADTGLTTGWREPFVRGVVTEACDAAIGLEPEGGSGA